MHFTARTYTVAPVFVAALINGDVSALDADEVKALDAFLDRLPAGPGHWSAADDAGADFEGRCDISRKRSLLARVSWFVRHDEDADAPAKPKPAALTVAIRLHGEDVAVVDPAAFDGVDVASLEDLVAALKVSVAVAIDDAVRDHVLPPRTPVCSACLANAHAAGEPDFSWRPTRQGEACGAADHEDAVTYTVRDSNAEWQVTCRPSDLGDTIAAGCVFDLEPQTWWLHVTATDPDGDVQTLRIPMEPEEPDCCEEEHSWQAPHVIVGGDKHNPGVTGHGGGVLCHEVCEHCGLSRYTDTWAQDPVDGRQGLMAVRYDTDVQAAVRLHYRQLGATAAEATDDYELGDEVDLSSFGAIYREGWVDAVQERADVTSVSVSPAGIATVTLL